MGNRREPLLRLLQRLLRLAAAVQGRHGSEQNDRQAQAARQRRGEWQGRVGQRSTVQRHHQSQQREHAAIVRDTRTAVPVGSATIVWMRPTIRVVHRGAEAADLRVVLATEEEVPSLPGGAGQAARRLGAKLLGAARETHVLGGDPLQAVVGLGTAGEGGSETLRRAAGCAVACATELRRSRLAIRVPRPRRGLDLRAAIEALAEGTALAAHAREPRATLAADHQAARPPTVCLLEVPPSADLPALQAAADRAAVAAAATALARDLGDAPGNLMGPLDLARRAAEEAEAAGLRAEVLDVERLRDMHAGLILAVGSGSARPPALAVLRYAPPGATRHVAVVGKGITFDAGGINLKDAKGLEHMTHDKAGAADAAGIAVGAARLELPVAVTAVLACAENLPGGSAYRPGDVLRGLDGSTVEIVDTDAEGRLVLADALTYAVARLDGPRPVDLIVDVATLTGSIVSALGNEAMGVFSNDDLLARRFLVAAEQAGEAAWQMPILPGHRAQLKSERADRKQCAERWGDCAIAAAFLEAYVAKRPWLHLDVAGVAYNEGSPEWPPYHPKVGTSGTGVRAVLRFLEALEAH